MSPNGNQNKVKQPVKKSPVTKVPKPRSPLPQLQPLPGAQTPPQPPPIQPAPLQPMPTPQPAAFTHAPAPVPPPVTPTAQMPMVSATPTAPPQPTAQYPPQYTTPTAPTPPAVQPAPVQPTPVQAQPQLGTQKKKRRKTQKQKKTRPSMQKPKGEKDKYFEIRYRTRILKGSFLPFLYGIISVLMLRNYTMEFPEHYQIDVLLISLGFLIGFGAMSGVTLSNIIRTKNHPRSESKMNFSVGLAISIPFIIITVILALFKGLASAWQFSIGFFLAAIFPALFVILFEVFTKKKFFIRETEDEPEKGRKLVAVAA
jgi:hypothetical protein